MKIPTSVFNPTRVAPRDHIQIRFDEWMKNGYGEAVYDNCLERALRIKRRGFTHFGIKAIWEAARYDHALRVGPDEQGWKLSNDYHSRMARLMMEREPELKGFFSLRGLRTDLP